MFVHTHPAIISNSLLLGTEIFFLALLAIGIYNHNPGPRAFGIMYREVRVILLSRAMRLNPITYSCQGLLWLVAATLVEIVPVVSRAYSLLRILVLNSL